MKNFFKRQRETKLRKWCVEQVVKAGVHQNDYNTIGEQAQSIYEWVLPKQNQSP